MVKAHSFAPYTYPPVKVEGKNIKYARLLMDDYAGVVSEMTAICQYLHHHFHLDEKYPDVAELLEEVSIVEMRHLEMLGETILLLGGDPQFGHFVKGKPTYWSGSYVKYSKDICQALRFDVQAERAAIANYRKRITQIRDKHIQKLLQRIILDEELHVKLFLEAARKYNCLT